MSMIMHETKVKRTWVPAIESKAKASCEWELNPASYEHSDKLVEHRYIFCSRKTFEVARKTIGE